MEENKKNSKNILISMLLIIIILLGGYLVYDKFVNKTLPLKCPVCEEKERPTNETTECNCSSDNEKSDTQTCGCEKCLVADIDYTEVFKDNKDFDGSYSSYYEISDSDPLKEIYVYAGIKMISNAIDIIFDNGNAGLNNLYILCKNGDVYKYSINDYENKVKTATKLNNLKDVIRFVKLKNCPDKDAGCFGNFGVIDKNMKYTNITTLY